MKLRLLLFILLLISRAFYSQVGINTTDPKSTLEVVGNPSDVSKPDGIIAPKITRANLITKTAYSAQQTGAIIYVTDLSGITNSSTAEILDVGYYYFNGSLWKSFNTSSYNFIFGDIKTGFQTADHSGWILLNGRLKTSLTATQQARATALGIGTNLPDATNSYFVQNGTPLGSISSSNVRTLAQNQLPNITLTGTTNTTGAHTHNLSDQVSAYTGTSNDNPYNTTAVNRYGVMKAVTALSNGDHSHTLTTTSINGNVTQQALDITPRSMSVNTFLYLGN